MRVLYHKWVRLSRHICSAELDIVAVCFNAFIAYPGNTSPIHVLGVNGEW